MRATQRCQHVGRRRLHAKAHPINTNRAIHLQQFHRYIVGVALNSELGIVMAHDGVERMHQLVRAHMRWRAPAHKHCRSRRRGCSTFNLGAQRQQILRHDVGFVGERGERAIVTLVPTKRHVHIHPETDLLGRCAGRPSHVCGGTNTNPRLAKRAGTSSTLTSSITAIARMSWARTVMTLPLKS